MVAKNKKHRSKLDESNGRIKVSKLQINKETIKDLTSDQTQKVKGGTGVCAGSLIGALTETCVASPEASPPRPAGQIPPTVIRLQCTP